MSIVRRAVLVAVALLALPTPSGAQNFYVWASASDSNTCLESSTAREGNEQLVQPDPRSANFERKWPKATPAAGMACLSAVMGSGEHILHFVSDGPTTFFTTGLSSIPSGINGVQRARIQAYEAHPITFRPPDGTYCVDLTGGQHDVYLLNLTCDMSLQTGATPAVKFDGNAHDIVMRNFRIKGAVAGTGNCVTIVSGSHHITIDYFSEIEDCKGRGVEDNGHDNAVTRNWFRNITGECIYSTGATATIARNDITNCGSASGAIRSTGANSIVFDNVVDHSVAGVKAGGTSPVVYFNTVAKNTNIGIEVLAGATGALVKNNGVPTSGTCANGSGVVDNGGGTTVATNSTADPGFHNCVGRNFNVPPSSPYVGTGTDLLNPWDRDIDYVLRPSGAVSIGAYEPPAGCPAGRCTGVTDFQAALNQAVCGDTIELTCGSDYNVGPYVLQRKYNCDGVHYTTITRSCALPDVPDVLGMCFQYGPNFAAEMAKKDQCKIDLQTLLETNAPKISVSGVAAVPGGYATGVNSAFYADWYKFEGLEFRSTASGFESIVQQLVLLGFDGPGPIAEVWPVRLDQIPEHYEFDRVSIHGNEAAVDDTIRHGIFANANYVTVHNSAIYGINDVTCCNTDAQAIMTAFGDTTYDYENNFIEASGEGILFGGGGALFWQQVPSNIIQRKNYFTKNPGWFQNAARFGYTFTHSGNKPSVKNNTECKNCNNALYDSNVFEFGTDTNQSGHGMLHQGVSDGHACFWCAVSNIEVVGNVFRHLIAGVTYAAQAGGDAATTPSQNVYYHDNVFYGLSRKYSDGSTSLEQAGYCFTFYSNSNIFGSEFVGSLRVDSSYPSYQTYRFNHNTCDSEGYLTVGTHLPFGLFNTNIPGSRAVNFEVKDNLAIIYEAGDAGAVQGGEGATCGNDHICNFNLVANGDALDDSNYAITNNAFFTTTNYQLWPFPAGNWYDRSADYTAADAVWSDVFESRATRDYRVKSASLYHAGNARQASDSKDMGADMSLVLAGAGVLGSPPDHAPTTAPIRLRFHAGLFRFKDEPAFAQQRAHIAHRREQRAEPWIAVRDDQDGLINGQRGHRAQDHIQLSAVRINGNDANPTQLRMVDRNARVQRHAAFGVGRQGRHQAGADIDGRFLAVAQHWEPRERWGNSRVVQHVRTTSTSRADAFWRNVRAPMACQTNAGSQRGDLCLTLGGN